jgi:hypothetical protein
MSGMSEAGCKQASADPRGDINEQVEDRSVPCNHGNPSGFYPSFLRITLLESISFLMERLFPLLSGITGKRKGKSKSGRGCLDDHSPVDFTFWRGL